jgi:threonine/homoserine/homoserine lactone efflux protein
LRSKTTEISLSADVKPASNIKLLTQGFLVGASNPKALLFFGALFPQFINPSAPQLPQFLILGATFVFFEALWLTIYALSAAKAKRWLQQPRRATLFNRATGIVFLVAAGFLASSKRATN